MPEEIPSPDIRSLTQVLAAAILYPHTGSDLKGACALAEQLIAWIEHKAEFETWAHQNIHVEKSWTEGTKHLTGESRRKRAEDKFLGWLKRKRISAIPTAVYHPKLHSFISFVRTIQDLRDRGFTGLELDWMKEKFDRPEKIPLEAKTANRRGKAAQKSRKPAKD
jgi:hypothetical protein